MSRRATFPFPAVASWRLAKRRRFDHWDHYTVLVLSVRAQELAIRLFDRVKAAGVIRSDIEVVDIALLFQQLAAVQIRNQRRSEQLRQRYLALIFDALRASVAAQLPGPPPEWKDINSRWDS